MNIKRSAGTRQFEHICAIAHGAHPEYRVEFDAVVKNQASSLSIRQGSVVSLNADGEYVIGCAAGTAGTTVYPVPCISMKNVFDPDVTTGRAGATVLLAYYSPVGDKITAIPCTAGYEIETTEFDATKTYVPNAALVPDTSTNIGKLTLATTQPGTTVPYVGFVSKAPYTDNYGNKRLSFWTNFIPADQSADTI